MLSIVGGIMMIVGAYFVMQGKIFNSVLTYMIADLCWLVLAIEKRDYIGAGFIAIGTVMGLYAYYKMSRGRMEKSLRHIDMKFDKNRKI